MTSLLTFPPQGPRGSQTQANTGPLEPRAQQTPRDPWAGLREADVRRNGLFELLKTADERLSPLLSALTPAAGNAPPEPRPMPPAPQIVPPLGEQVAKFLESRRREGGTKGIV